MAADVLAHDMRTLERWVGTANAAWLYDRVRGISHSSVEPRLPAKQMSREETFDRDIADAIALSAELRHLSAKVAADLRADGLDARTITVKLRTNDFTTRSAGKTFDEPVESDRAIIDTADALLKQLRAEHRRPVRLVGVSLSNLRPARDARQLTMFDGSAKPEGTPEGERDRELSRAMDRVREKFGDDAIRAGPERRGTIGEKGARKPR